MGRKIYHEISAGIAPAKPREFTLDIQRTKNVMVRLSRNYVSVSCEMSTASDPATLLSTRSPVLSRAVKAALLLYLLHYGRSYPFREVRCRVGDRAETFSFDEDHPPVYSLIRRKLRPLDPAWKTQALSEKVIRLSQKENDRRIAALCSYLLGKSADFETERFRCMWTAINGLYEFYNNDVLKKTDYGEKEHIKRFLQLYSHNCSMLDDDERKNCKTPLSILIYKTPDFQTAIKDPASDVAKQTRLTIQRKTGKNYQIDPCLYYLFQMSYTLRCELFHGNSPIKLLSFAEESEILLLRACSDLMEDFLDFNLHRWFDDDFIANNVASARNYLTPFADHIREEKDQ